jgi:2-methylcitrate synthase/citrate synthase II
MSAETVEDRYFPGLEGVIANETSIANVEGQNGNGGLEYRGYRIEDLAEHASFEETAYLMLHGELPGRAQLREFEARLRNSRLIPEPLTELLRTIPASIHPMDVLRTSVSVISHFDPEVAAPPTDHAANVRKAERVLAKMATAVAYRERISKGLTLVPPRDDLDHSANFLNMVNGRVPSETMRKAFDLSLVLYTEHELNASTFAARVTVSTLSDLYSGLVSAIGTLKGSLHGGANEEAWKVLEKVGAPENAEAWIADALVRKERIMGFGHRVYKTGDPRARILKRHCQMLAHEIGDDRWERIAEPIERAVTEQKHLPPNVDWPSARLYHYMGLDIEIYTPIFALARVAGWSAHIIEQLEHNRLMRPRARYIGPPNRVVPPIEARG